MSKSCGDEGGSPNRSITTELTDLDSIQTLHIDDVDENVEDHRSRQHVRQVNHQSGGGGHSRGRGQTHHHGGRSQHHSSSHHSSRGNGGGGKGPPREEDGGAGCLKGLKHITAKKHGHHQGRAPKLPQQVPVPAHAPGGGVMLSAGTDPNLVISGHQELNTLYASNDVHTGPITVNVCNAPNSSTVQCGCENVNCPFCNLMLSIEKTDPTVLQ